MQYIRENLKQEHLSIIDDSYKESAIPVISLLYIDHGWEVDADVSSYKHQHDYWQLEVITAGNVELEIEGKVFLFQDHSFCLIPPEIPHRITYKSDRETWSIKFAAEKFKGNFEPLTLPNDTIGTKNYCEIFLNIINEHKKITPPLYPLITYWLAGLLPICYAHVNYPQPPAWLTNVRDNIILNGGNYESLDEVAKFTGYSRIYLSALFKKHTQMNLKQFVDNERAVIAKRKMLYSNLNITQVAESMGFSDVFSFSKFFKRVTGLSPTHFLESYNAARPQK
jgi:AraC family transcriptional activator of pobA